MLIGYFGYIFWSYFLIKNCKKNWFQIFPFVLSRFFNTSQSLHDRVLRWFVVAWADLAIWRHISYVYTTRENCACAFFLSYAFRNHWFLKQNTHKIETAGSDSENGYETTDSDYIFPVEIGPFDILYDGSWARRGRKIDLDNWSLKCTQWWSWFGIV